jgi:RNA polymerase sigma factor (sigma-70 family)
VLDDETLYQQVLSKDEAALVELVSRYHNAIYKFLYRYSGDAALADDIAQETFIRLINFRGPSPRCFRAWVYTIAANLIRDHFRSAGYRYEQATDFEDGVEPTADHDDLVGHEHDDVLAALAKLSPEHRETILLRFYHALKLEEIAEITGVPIGTVKSRLFHALKGLKGFLAVTETVHDRT